MEEKCFIIEISQEVFFFYQWNFSFFHLTHVISPKKFLFFILFLPYFLYLPFNRHSKNVSLHLFHFNFNSYIINFFYATFFFMTLSFSRLSIKIKGEENIFFFIQFISDDDETTNAHTRNFQSQKFFSSFIQKTIFSFSSCFYTISNKCENWRKVYIWNLT
jgi:hypothetical protein